MMVLAPVRDKPVLKALQNLMVLSEKVVAGAMALPVNTQLVDLEKLMVLLPLPTCMVDPVAVQDNTWVPVLEVVQYPWKPMETEM